MPRHPQSEVVAMPTDRPAGVGLAIAQRAPVHLARRLSQVLLSHVSQAVPAGMARNEFGVLVGISQTPGIDQKRLAATMAFDATTVGQLIDNLEQKGWVRRTVSPNDRRVNVVDVTKIGHEILAEYRPKVLKAQKDALACLSKEESKTLISLMARVIEANPAHDRPGGGRRSPRASAG
jgi:DNA-binding MarR family transcriptional regulator